MTFINPAILPALTAAALPLLIHLFSRQRRREVEFSTLRFLKKLEKKRMRRVRLTEWILLALRTLAVFFIIFAFTRPAVQHSSGIIEGESGTSAVLVIDNSISSQVQTERGTALSEQIARTLEALEVFSENDEAVIVTAGEPAAQITPRSLPGGDAKLRKKIFELGSADAAADWEGVFAHVEKFFSESENPNREVYVFSALLSRSFVLDSLISQKGEAFKTYLFPVATGELNDLAVESVHRETKILLKGKTVDISAKIVNHGESEVKDIPISLYIDGERTASINTDISGRSESQIKLKFVPQRGGFLTGRVKLDIDDALAADNQSCFSVYIPEIIEAAIAGDSAETALIATALNPGSRTDYSIESTVLRTTLEINELPERTVLIITGLSSISTYFTEAVRQRLAQGGGVMVFPSLEVEPGRFNRQFAEPLGISSLLDLERSEDGVTWERIDYSHPIFEGVFEKTAAVESPRLNRFFTFAGDKGSEIIGLSRGGSFLKEYSSGAGRILVFASGVEGGWGDFSRRGIFAPLLHRSVTYLASQNGGGEVSISAGKQLEYFPDSDMAGLQMSVPGGELIELTTSDEERSRKVVYSATGNAGIYTLLSGGETIQLFPVNPAQISGLRQEIPVIANGGVFYPKRDLTLAAFVKTGRLGKELWKIFLVAGLLCLVIEMLIVKLTK